MIQNGPCKKYIDSLKNDLICAIWQNIFQLDGVAWRGAAFFFSQYYDVIFIVDNLEFHRSKLRCSTILPKHRLRCVWTQSLGIHPSETALQTGASWTSAGLRHCHTQFSIRTLGHPAPIAHISALGVLPLFRSLFHAPPARLSLSQPQQRLFRCLNPDEDFRRPTQPKNNPDLGTSWCRQLVLLPIEIKTN